MPDLKPQSRIGGAVHGCHTFSTLCCWFFLLKSHCGIAKSHCGIAKTHYGIVKSQWRIAKSHCSIAKMNPETDRPKRFWIWFQFDEFENLPMDIQKPFLPKIKASRVKTVELTPRSVVLIPRSGTSTFPKACFVLTMQYFIPRKKVHQYMENIALPYSTKKLNRFKTKEKNKNSLAFCWICGSPPATEMMILRLQISWRPCDQIWRFIGLWATF